MTRSGERVIAGEEAQPYGASGQVSALVAEALADGHLDETERGELVP